MQTESLQHIPMQIYSVIKTAEIYLEIQWSPIFILLSGYPFISMYWKQLSGKSYCVTVRTGKCCRYFYFRVSRGHRDGELSPLIVVGSQLFVDCGLP